MGSRKSRDVHAKEEKRHVNKRYDLRKRNTQDDDEQDAVFKHGRGIEIQGGKRRKRSSEGEIPAAKRHCNASGMITEDVSQVFKANDNDVPDTQYNPLTSTNLYHDLIEETKAAVEKKEKCNPNDYSAVVIEVASVNDAFCNAKYRLVDIKYQKVMNSRRRRLLSRKHSYFKNDSIDKSVRFTFNKNVTDTATVCFGTTKGYTLGVLAGVSAGPPGGGVQFGVGGSYSNFKSYGEIVAHQVSKNLSAEVEITPKQCVTAVEEVHCTEYEAVCTLDIMICASHQFKYRINGKKPSHAQIGFKTVMKHRQESFEKLKMTTIEIDGVEHICVQCDCECIIEEHEHTLNIKPEECSQDKVPNLQ